MGDLASFEHEGTMARTCSQQGACHEVAMFDLLDDECDADDASLNHHDNSILL